MPSIRQKIGVGDEAYIDVERAGFYQPGKPYEVDDAKAEALKATGKYEDHDPETEPSTWNGKTPAQELEEAEAAERDRLAREEAELEELERLTNPNPPAEPGNEDPVEGADTTPAEPPTEDELELETEE
ncbi:hypothetical protein D3C86_1374600 [compost metagenome]